MASHGMPRASGLVDRSETARKKEAKKIATYSALVNELQTKVQAQDYSADTLVLTTNLLTQNPEYYSVWNKRRLVLQDVFTKELASSAASESTPSSPLNTAQHEISLLIKEDLAFLIPLLKNFPKCYWIWNHRAWLLQQASKHLPVSSSKRLWQEELGLVSKMLAMDSRNFHGWGYRRTVIRSLEECETLDQETTQIRKYPTLDKETTQPEPVQETKPTTMTEHEFAYTTKMIMSNLSNFSAWHNRLQLIPKLLREREADSKARRKMLDDEFDFILQALYTDPYDQSLWFYHNWIMSTLLPETPPGSTIVLDLTNQERLHYLDIQIDTIKDILDGSEDCKYIYQALLTYAVQYLNIEGGNEKFTNADISVWLDQLELLDPLRKGRWQDLRRSLKL